MSAQTLQKSTSSVDEDQKEEEKQEQQPQEGGVQELTVLSQGLGAGLLLGLDDISQHNVAFKTFNDPEIASNLLDFENPEALSKYSQAQKYLRTKYKKNIELKQDLEYKVLNYRHKIGYADFEKRSQAINLATRTHLLVDGTERQIKLQSTIRIFGIEGEAADKFKKEFYDWSHDHPGEDINKYLLEQGKKTTTITGEELKKAEQQVKKEYQGARKEAISQTEEVGKRAQDTIEEVIDPKTKSLTPEELEAKWDYIAKGPSQTTPTITKTPQPSVQAVSMTPVPPTFTTTTTTIPSVSYTQTPSPIPQIPKPPPSIPNPPQMPPGISSRLTNLINLRQRMFSSFTNKIANSALGQAAKTASGFIGKSAVKLGSKILSKTGLKVLGQAIGSALPGIGNAVVGLLQATGLDEKLTKFAFYGAAFAVGSIVIVFVLILVLVSGSATNMPTMTSADAIVVPTIKNEVGAHNWPDFEKAVLGALDTNGHDQVEK